MDEIDAVLDVPEIVPAEMPPLRLSDLIREGSALHPQAIGNWRGQKGETCALTAAYEAAKARGLL